MAVCPCVSVYLHAICHMPMPEHLHVCMCACLHACTSLYAHVSLHLSGQIYLRICVGSLAQVLNVQH